MIGSGLIDRLLAAIYRRGQSIVESSDRAANEKRSALRAVTNAISTAMVQAEQDREGGSHVAQRAAFAAAAEASSIVHEIGDDDARRLVLDWKDRFDAIPKGWKKQQQYHSQPPGYPEPAWSELREAARAATDRLGVVLR